MNRINNREVIIESYSFVTNEDFFTQLCDETYNWVGKLLSVAGHYMLFYRRETNQLVPLMPSIAFSKEASEEERRFVELVGDFPELSFELALRLFETQPNRDNKIAVLVNDHQFQEYQHNTPSEHEIAILKRQYYHTNVSLPEPLIKIARKYQDNNNFIEDNNGKRTAGSTLPSKTMYYSENVLRNRFADRRRYMLEKLPGFFWREAIYSDGHRRQFVYKEEGTNVEVCLFDGRHGCGCSGEMLELLLLLSEKNVRNLILFIPSECRIPVNGAIEVAMRSLVNFEHVAAGWGSLQPSSRDTLLGNQLEIVFDSLTLYH